MRRLALRGPSALLLVLVVGACEKGAPAKATSAPGATLDDLASIEAELARNAAELGSLGVVIAQRAEREPGLGDSDSGDVTKRADNVKKPSGEPDAAEGGDGPPEPTPDPGTAPPSITDNHRPKPPTKPSSITPPPTTPGSTTPSSPPDDAAAESTSAEACGRICSLADVSCDLSDRICVLAARHTGDARYEDACWNAQRQCEAATDACGDCDAGREGACADAP